MIRALAEATGGALLVVLFAAAWLWFLPPAHGAECRGTVASWYGTESCVSTPCKTRSGELFTGRAMTAAMPSARHIGERWRVSANGKSITVRINDTGGFAKYGRGIDLSKAAFAKLAPLARGTLCVRLERLS